MKIELGQQELDQWFIPLGKLIVSCGAIEQATLSWIELLKGKAERDAARKSRFEKRRHLALKAVDRSTCSAEAKQSAHATWAQADEPFRVRNIVAHGGVVTARLKDGRIVTGFHKLADSTADEHHLLFVQLVDRSANEAGGVALALDAVLSPDSQGTPYLELSLPARRQLPRSLNAPVAPPSRYSARFVTP